MPPTALHSIHFIIILKMQSAFSFFIHEWSIFGRDNQICTFPMNLTDVDLIKVNWVSNDFFSWFWIILKWKYFWSNNFSRQLCIFELVEEGDSDGDGKINFDEFRTLLSPHYKPSSKGEIKSVRPFITHDFIFKIF